MELMRRYTGHLAAALRIATQLQQMQTNAIAGYGLMRASGRPMFLLDWTCRVLSANDLAQDMVERGDTFAIRGGVLHCLHADNRQTLAETLADFSHGKRKRMALRLRGDHRALTFCSLWDLRPESTMAAFGTLPTILLTVTHPPAGRVDPVWLGSLFELSPAEVRVASGLMRGEALREIAESLRVSIETVRSQLKSICAKTQTHHQSDLVALLLRVAVP